MFDEMEDMNNYFTAGMRIVCWVLSLVGHYLLFSPVIALLKWIPLVGWLLGSLVSFAAGLFALVMATLVHFLVLGVAWVFYRPLIGSLFLATTGLLCFLIFYPYAPQL